MAGATSRRAGAGERRRLDSAPLSAETSFLLARATALTLAHGNEVLSPLGLKVRSYSVLALAAAGYRPSQRDLAAYLRLDPSQVVALIDDLERRDLVARDPDPSDRRANVVVATAAGSDLASHAHEVLAESEDLLFSGLTAHERDTLAALLRRIALPE